MTMSALTVQRPWDYALTHGKLIENRKQKPPVNLWGVRIALHAGLKYDYDGARFIKRVLGLSELPECLPGVIFATTTIVGYVERGTEACARASTKTLASAAELLPFAESRWFFGPYGYVLQDTRVLARPVPARGMQGWWPVPADVEERVRAQEAA